MLTYVTDNQRRSCENSNLRNESLNGDCQQFHQYQQNGYPHLT